MNGANDYKEMTLSEFRKKTHYKEILVSGLQDYKGNPLEKIVAFWRRKSLLPFIGTGSWLRLSPAQLIWLRILDDLRKINFPVKAMQQVCNYFFIDASNDNLPKKMLEAKKAEIQKKAQLTRLTDEDQFWLQHTEEALSQEEYLAIKKIDTNYLSSLINSVLTHERDASIYIFFEGTVAEFLGNTYVGHKEVDLQITKPYIHLSVTHYLKEFLSDTELSTIIVNHFLNSDEIKILKEMQSKNEKQITINMSGGKIKKIQSTKTGVIKNKDAAAIRNVLNLGNYESITIDTVDDKTLSYKLTKKR